MRLDLLETYAAIVVTGTTQGAAVELGISQPAVSRRLAQLEASLGLALFRRERGRLVPTRDGAILQGQIAGLVEAGRRLHGRAEELRSGNSAEITLAVAFPASLAHSVVPQIVSRFLEAHDRVRLELHTGPYDAIERMLLDGRAELGFLRVPTTQAGLRVAPALVSHTVCVMPEGHPLATYERVTVDDLAGVPLILLGRMRAPRRELDALFAARGLRPAIRVEVHSVGSACGLAAAGIGVALVNALMAADYAALPVEIRPLAEDVRHAFAFASGARVPIGPAAEAFLRIALHVFDELATPTAGR